MSSIVCQGLQSCLEPRFVEPRVLRHNNRGSRNNDDDDNKNNKSNNNGDLGAWSFIQALSNTTNSCKEVTENEKIYVYPLAKRSSSMLSTKSLEMCTESLGSETGSDISESSNESFYFSSVPRECHAIQRSKSREFTKTLDRSGSFPPPLSSISGSDSVQVRPHREGGRLVLKAVTVSSCNTYFQAERVDGRLRLCLLKDCSVNEEKVKNDEEDADQKVIEEHENGGGGGAEDVDDTAGVGDGVDDDYNWEEDIEGNNAKVRCEIGIGELPRPGRCGPGSKGMSSWEPLWVAIS